MAQQTDSYTMVEGEVEFSTDGAAFTSYAGHIANVTVSAGERTIGQKHTYDGDTPLLHGGKRAALVVAVEVTVGAPNAVPQTLVRTAYETRSGLWIRWSPAGGNSGDERFTSSQGIVENPPYQVGEPDSGEAISYEFNLHIATITPALVP